MTVKELRGVDAARTDPVGPYCKRRPARRKLPEPITISVDEWIKMPDNPRQRDTERHARHAVKNHLKVADETHCDVVAAVCGGDWYKIDGHTRAYLWEHNQLDRPDNISVAVWECDSVDDVVALYDRFDNRHAAEDGGDRMSGALREIGIQLHSPYLLTYRFATSIKMAYSYVVGAHNDWSFMRYAYADWHDNVRCAAYFRSELEVLDDLKVSGRRFHKWTFIAAFLTIKRDPNNVEFWRRYQLDQGVKNEESEDAVHALDRISADLTRQQGTSAIDCFGKALSAVENFRIGRVYSVKASGIKTSGEDAIRKYLKRLPPPALRVNRP